MVYRPEGISMSEDILRAAKKVSEKLDSDVLFFSGAIDRNSWLSVVNQVKSLKVLRTSVLLILVTPGGDPDAAFKIGRFLQQRYTTVATFIPGWCKSAGTLITLASQKIYIGDLGELGPLDIQIAKPDELFEMSSGLSVQVALTTLEQAAGKMFVHLLLSIRGDTFRGITTRTAAELATSIVGSLLEPIYRQIEPIKIGETQRAMSITKNYGARLAQASKSLKSARALDFLITSYPDHGFVIDREEASQLLNGVERPTSELEALSDVLGDAALYPKDGGMTDVRFLSPEATNAIPRKPRVRPKARLDMEKDGVQNPATRNGDSKRGAPKDSVGSVGKRARPPPSQRAGNGFAPQGLLPNGASDSKGKRLGKAE
jgi:hypothetical protein